MRSESTKNWLGVGLLALAALQTVAPVRRYVFPPPFHDDFPAAGLDPLYNEHLIPDVGGLGLALTGMLYFATRVLDSKVVLPAVIGYSICAAAHFTFHVRHFDHSSLLDAVAVGTGLGIDVVLALVLVRVGRRAQRTASAAVPGSETGIRRSISEGRLA
ncbi:hypothetical protein ACIO8H_34645 [Streptomyces sp. NPDC087226]|jgi:hypothetical protein|uniref:hypothetical protein n=1 Tax=Streptomyces sp. NPDC087226 TaxID=3365771 RepID=UPI0037F80002